MAATKVAFRRVHTGEPPIDQAQRMAQQVAQQQGAHPFAGGRLIDAEDGQPAGTGLQFTAFTTRLIKHGLGRKPRGFVEVYGADAASAAKVRLRSTSYAGSGASSLTHICLTPEASGVCFLFVF